MPARRGSQIAGPQVQERNGARVVIVAVLNQGGDVTIGADGDGLRADRVERR